MVFNLIAQLVLSTCVLELRRGRVELPSIQHLPIVIVTGTRRGFQLLVTTFNTNFR